MAGRKSDFTLTKLDDLFSTQEQRDEEKLSKIRDIPLTEIDDFPDHPFKVRDDEDKLLGISDTQLSYVTNADAGKGLLKCAGSIVPFEDKYPTDTKLYKLMTTKPKDLLA